MTIDINTDRAGITKTNQLCGILSINITIEGQIISYCGHTTFQHCAKTDDNKICFRTGMISVWFRILGSTVLVLYQVPH